MRLILSGLGVAVLAASGAGAQDPSVDPALQREAEGLIDRVWSSALVTCGTSAFEVLDNRVVIELDRPEYHLAPSHLHKAAIEHGYQFQATAIASARRWRWAPLTPKGKLAWTAWQEGQDMAVRYDEFGSSRGSTEVQDAVLQFDLVRKDGKWRANVPLSPLNSAIRTFDPTNIAPPPAAPACERLNSTP